GSNTQTTTALSANATTTIYAKAVDGVSNTSSCTSIGSYTNDLTLPTITLASVTTTSPGQTLTPSVAFTLSETATVTLYSESGCSSSISAAAVLSAGSNTQTTTTLSANATTTIYAKAIDTSLNTSACTSIGSYTNDLTLPTITLASVTTTSPGQSLTPSVAYTLSEAATVTLYSESGCSSSISTAAVLSAGSNTQTTTALSANAITTIYAKAIDTSLNTSACTSIGSYETDTQGPLFPTIAINSESTHTNTVLVDLTLSAVGSGEMFITNTAGCATGGNWETYSSSKTAWVLNQTNAIATVFVKFRDIALNESTCISDTIVHDNISATVASITSSNANGTFTSAEIVSVQVVFSEAVTVSTVSGTPTLTLETGSTDATASYASGSGTDTLSFTYTISHGEYSSDLDYVATSSLALNGGTIKDAATNNSTNTLPAPGAANSLSANKALVIYTGARITNVTSSHANGVYSDGQTISIQVIFENSVDVTGIPTLTLETGTVDSVVNYSSGTGTNTLSFNYTVATGNNSADLVYVGTNSLSTENGSTIKDSWLNNAILTLATPGLTGSLSFNKNIVVDSVPKVTQVTSTVTNATYGVGSVIPIQIIFGETVTVTGTPQLTLETGTIDEVINYTSGSGSNTLVFNYTVAQGDTSADLNYKDTSSLAFNSGSIKDSNGNEATLTLPTLSDANSLAGNKAIVIDSVPSVSNITATTSDGTYEPGDSISIQVLFNLAVTVTGTPTLTLETGTTDTVVSYTSGSGTSSLIFNYTVSDGDLFSDLDYVATTSLELNGGTIQSTASQNAILTLVSPGVSGSLGANKALRSLLLRTTSWTNNNEEFGSSLASGDIDNDGKPDVIVGIPGFNSGDGKIIIYSGQDNNVLFEITGTSSAGDELGSAITTADVNNDGYDDFIIGIPLFDGTTGTDRGKVTVYNGADGSILYSIIGAAGGDKLGSAVAKVGDVDGDGKEDFIIGVPFADQGGTQRGQATVYSGVDGSVYATISGSENNALLGSGVSGAGDINNDGIPDFMISAPLADSTGSDRGKVRIYSGDNLSVLYTKFGSADQDKFGSTLSGGSDVNGDGRADFMIGSPFVNGAGTDRGEVIVYSGTTGTALYTLTGTNDNDYLGFSISFAGDVNNDNGKDFIIGIPQSDGGGGGSSLRGQAKVYSGLTGTPLYTVNGPSDGDALGRTVLGLGGSIETDSHDDFVISIPLADAGGTDRGKIKIFR
ncbi:MAG: hypothetical protein EXR74_03670, partial [Bdellovibrionales bacterium]|nr:hypothetical protein [Bdellovibrionales bacterium]